MTQSCRQLHPAQEFLGWSEGEALCPYCARFIDNTAWVLYYNGIMNLTNFRYIPWGNAHFTQAGLSRVVCMFNWPMPCSLVQYCRKELHASMAQENVA